MAQSVGDWFARKYRELTGEPEPPPPSAKSDASHQQATEKAIGPRYQKHDASATTEKHGSVRNIPKKAAPKKSGSVRNIPHG